MNAVIALDHYDRKSGTPSYKGVPVAITKSELRLRLSVRPQLSRPCFRGR